MPAFGMIALVLTGLGYGESEEKPTVSKTDLFRFVGAVPCLFQDDLCPQALLGFSRQGYAGEDPFQDPNGLPKDTVTGVSPIVLGFPDNPPFDWNRYVFTSPLTRHLYVVLNEVSSTGKNHAMLSEWKTEKDKLVFVRLLPQVHDIPIGVLSVVGKPQKAGRGFLVLLLGRGSDAGVNLQDYRVLKFDARGNPTVIARQTNRSEIPVADILARLNDGQEAEEVIDSSLVCGLAPNGKSLRCTKNRTQIHYSVSGPDEKPLGQEHFTLELPKDALK